MAPISNLIAAIALAYGLCGSLTTAHPGEEGHDAKSIAREMRRTAAIAEYQKRQLDACHDSEHVREMYERAIQRRTATAQRLREERGLTDTPFLDRRTLNDFKSWEKASHNKTGGMLTPSSPPGTLFGANATCIQTPDNANGPYYVTGEQIRSNVVDGQVGVPMHLEMQYIDIKTCKPATNILVDIWSCNALGIYSGVSAAGEGGLNTAYLRGVQKSDTDGVVNFDTIFPGHYQGRATHEHIITHVGATVQPNGSYTGGKINHLSQLFFDTALVNAVEATTPYNQNKIPHTSNDADGYTGYAASKAYDPLPSYIFLGNKIEQGLFVWSLVGIDQTNDVSKYATNAAYVDATGGHNNPGFNMGIVATPPPNTHGKREDGEDDEEAEWEVLGEE